MRFSAGKMLRIGALVALAALGGCATTAGFRDNSAAISSTTRFDPARLAGRWVVRARFAGEDAPLLPAEVIFHQGQTGQDITAIETHGVRPGGRFSVTQVAPGRFRAENGQEYWLLWVDADWRTAAIGSPDGRFGWILDREARGGADRLQAARDVFAWIGYDMARLVELAPAPAGQQ